VYVIILLYSHSMFFVCACTVFQHCGTKPLRVYDKLILSWFSI